MLFGGSGADVFVFRNLTETTTTAVGCDRIADFSFGQHDRIDLSAIDADNGQGGDQAFLFVGTAAFSGQAGELRADRVPTPGKLVWLVSGDVDGDGQADLVIRVDQVLRVSDLVFDL